MIIHYLSIIQYIYIYTCIFVSIISHYDPYWSIIIISYHIHHLIPIDIPTSSQIPFIELDDGNIYRKDLYLMVKTMVSCRFSLKPIHWPMSSHFWLHSQPQEPVRLLRLDPTQPLVLWLQGRASLAKDVPADLHHGHALTNGANKMSSYVLIGSQHVLLVLVQWYIFECRLHLLVNINIINWFNMIQYDSIYHDILWIRFKIAHRCLITMNSSIFGKISSPPHPLNWVIRQLGASPDSLD